MSAGFLTAVERERFPGAQRGPLHVLCPHGPERAPIPGKGAPASRLRSALALGAAPEFPVECPGSKVTAYEST